MMSCRLGLILLCWLGIWGQAKASNQYTERARLIYQKIQNYCRLSFGETPGLGFPRFATRGAYLAGDSLLIDQKLLELVYRTFPPEEADASIAWIMGHELGHFFEGESCQGNRILALSSGPFSVQHKSIRTRELRADYFGGFVAYLAEYDVLTPASRLVALLDQHFGQGPSYPNLVQRQATVQQVVQRIEELIITFQMGNLLTLIRQNELATHCYQEILRDFQSREILNNLGLAYLRTALEYADPTDYPFAFPFEIDPYTRLAKQIRDPQTPDPVQFRLFIDQAEACFQKAYQQEPSYSPARRNLAALALLNNDPTRAKKWIEPLTWLAAPAEMKDQSQDAYREQLLVAHAQLLTHRQKRMKQARQRYEQILLHCPWQDIRLVAQLNLEALSQEDTPMARSIVRQTHFEHIDGKSYQGGRMLNQLQLVKLTLSSGVSIQYQIDQRVAWLIMEGKYVFQLPRAKQKTVKEIGLRTPYEELLQGYPPANELVFTRTGKVHVDYGNGILFWIDENDLVIRWCLFYYD